MLFCYAPWSGPDERHRFDALFRWGTTMRALLIVVKLVLSVLGVVVFLPLHILGSVLSRILVRKQSAVTLRIEFASREAFITAQYGTGEQEAPNLLIAYILYLSQYFYACDNRQVLPVANCLAEHVGNRGNPCQLTGVLLEAVRGTLSTIEARAFADKFHIRFTHPSLIAKVLRRAEKGQVHFW